MPQLQSFVGLVCFLGLAWALSCQRQRIPVRTVVWGLGLQIGIGILILKTAFGRGIFQWAQQAVSKIQDFAEEGAKMVFGPLASDEALIPVFGQENAFIFAVTITAVIIVISALSSLLYHWGILPKIVQGMAWIMNRVMGTSGSESLAAAANVFAGQTEAPLIVKPYLNGMTRSELMALMTGGMATIAGSVLIIYVFLGVEAGHLLTASVMSAPAALMIAKIMIPESETSETTAGAQAGVEHRAVNSIDALVVGSTDGMKLAINVIAMLITFTAVVAMVNYLIGAVTPDVWNLSLQRILGWINVPVAFLMGVPSTDCLAVAEALGERIVLNEFFGYQRITAIESELSPRAFVIASYALCGFANFASIAIQIGGIGALAPERREDLARLGIRSMVAGLLACYTTACVAGMLI